MSDTGPGSAYDISEDDEGLLPPDESPDPDEFDDDLDELGYSPLDRPSGNLSWGFTAREARTTEPLSRRLARELPDVGADLDDEGDPLVDEVAIDGGAGSAEEAAVHVIDPDERG